MGDGKPSEWEVPSIVPVEDQEERKKAVRALKKKEYEKEPIRY